MSVSVNCASGVATIQCLRDKHWLSWHKLKGRIKSRSLIPLAFAAGYANQVDAVAIAMPVG